ncbi:hypothetical protein BS78_04G313500 [Paspalum vaginatum]|nr:hypothetical protein BS78_04G313500 [Paspalum vaginatum]
MLGSRNLGHGAAVYVGHAGSPSGSVPHFSFLHPSSAEAWPDTHRRVAADRLLFGFRCLLRPCSSLVLLLLFISLILLPVWSQRCYAGQVGIEELARCLHRNLFQEKLTSIHWAHYNVKSEMFPTIHSKDGAAILVRKLPHYPNPPGVFVGDTVVFRDPDRPSQYLSGRVAAIEGCEMLSTDEKDEPFVLAHNHCWVLVDNRSLPPKTAKDSRSFGPLPLTAIYGRAMYSLMASSNHGPIQNSYFQLQTLFIDI